MTRKAIVYNKNYVMRLREAREYTTGDVLRTYLLVITVIIDHHAAAECIEYEN